MSLASLAKVYEFYTSCSSFASTCTTIAKVQVVDDKKSTIDKVLDFTTEPYRCLFGGKNADVDGENVHCISSWKEKGKPLSKESAPSLKAKEKKSGFWGTAFKVGMVALLVVSAVFIVFKLFKYAFSKNEKQQKAVANIKPTPQYVGSPSKILANPNEINDELARIAKTGKISTLIFYTNPESSYGPTLSNFGIRSWQKVIVPQQAHLNFCENNQIKDSNNKPKKIAMESFKTLAEAQSFSTASRFAFWSKPTKAIVSYQTVK